MTIHELEREMLSLPASERARLARRLIESLDPEGHERDQAPVEAAWRAEIERRLEEIDRGVVETIPAAEALAAMRALLRS